MEINKKPLILITNDDGVQAKGIKCLVESIRPLGEVVVVAPDTVRSGMSSAITSNIPIRVNLLKKEEDLTVYSCTGTPVDCVKLAMNEILPKKPDLVISGINHGSNSAICVIYSGTVGAGLEGCIFDIPSIALSLTSHSPHADFTEACKYGKIVAEKVLKDGMPQGVCLNVNIPNISEVKGLKVCKQTPGRWGAEFMKSKDAMGKDIFWLTGIFKNYTPEDDTTDEWALANGYASIVPIKVDMTAYETLKNVETMFAEHNS